MTLHQDVSQEDLLARADALRARLIERQGETEALTRYPASTHDDFTRAGFYQLLVPRRFGGLEVDLSTFWRVLVAIARGCPSTAWCYGVAAGTALQVGAWFEEQTQAEVFGDGHFISPTVAPPAGVAARERSGWILNGTHRYASGAPYATHFVGQTFADAVDTDGRRSLLLFVAPRSSWTMLDDWGDLLGLKGSGSNSVHFADAYIPSRYVLENVSMVDVDLGDTGPGWRLHGNPMYAVRTAFVFQSEIAAIMIGAAKGALDEYESIIKARTTQRPPIVARYLDPDYQRWFGIALGKIATAEAALLQASEQYLQSCREAAQQGVGLSREEDLRLNIIARQAMGLAWDAMQNYLFKTAGSSAAARGARIERIYRDMSTGWSHFQNLVGDWAARELAREHFGLTLDQ